jgi:RHH-type transcriptional regulator, rel operon repressor / antitoxin RelB
MLAIRLHPDIETRLKVLAKKTGRTKTFYARQAIVQYLEDLEDFDVARERLARPAKTFSAKALKEALKR